MKVSQLIALLEGQDPDAKVRIASQPSWPLRNIVRNVVAESDLEQEEDNESDSDPIVWIAIEQISSYSDESPYAPSEAWGC